MAEVGRPLKVSTPEEMESRCQLYLQANPSTATITGLHLALGLTREGLAEYGRRAEYSDIVNYYKMKVAEGYERDLRIMKNPTGAIFAMKVMGYTEKTSDININLGGQDANPVAVNHQTMSPEQLEVYKQAARKLAELSKQ